MGSKARYYPVIVANMVLFSMTGDLPLTLDTWMKLSLKKTLLPLLSIHVICFDQEAFLGGLSNILYGLGAVNLMLWIDEQDF